MLGTGCGFRRALTEWPRVADGSRSMVVAEIARRTRLGASVEEIAERLDGDGAFASSLADALRVAARVDVHGADAAAAMLEASARAIRERASRTGAAEAATAGARLSGRLVAGLPVAFLLFVPAAASEGIDSLDVTLFAAGGGLIAAGMRWIARCNPAAPRPSRGSVALVEIAALIRGGIPMGHALEIVARSTPWGALSSAAAGSRLGLPWSAALRRAGDPEADHLASIFETSLHTGSDATPALERLLDDVLEREEQIFEKKLRRAPVVMVLPLVLCILPGFALMTIGPFLRRLVA